MAAPITDGAADSAVASSKAAWQAIFPFEIRAATASETSGAIVMSGGCFVLKFPLCRLAMVPSRICCAMVLIVNTKLTQGRGGRNQAEPQNIEQGMSNVEVWNRCALPFIIKMAEHLTSTFCGSIFDIHLFPLGNPSGI
jgi:hypothetical protein